MSKRRKREKLEAGGPLAIPHSLALLSDFSHSLIEFTDFITKSHGNPLNNREDLGRLNRIHKVAADVASHHMEISIALMDAVIQKRKMELQEFELNENRALISIAIEYERSMVKSISNDLAYGYHEKYGN
jgi:hypothetical protein